HSSAADRWQPAQVSLPTKAAAVSVPPDESRWRSGHRSARTAAAATTASAKVATRSIHPNERTTSRSPWRDFVPLLSGAAADDVSCPCCFAGRCLSRDIPITIPSRDVRQWSTPAAEQAQKHHEQVDEVEIERQRAHHGLAARDRPVVHGIVHLLDLLGIVCRETGEHEDADDRDDPVEPARLEEDVDEARDDHADQAHEQERA